MVSRFELHRVKIKGQSHWRRFSKEGRKNDSQNEIDINDKERVENTKDNTKCGLSGLEAFLRNITVLFRLQRASDPAFIKLQEHMNNFATNIQRYRFQLDHRMNSSKKDGINSRKLCHQVRQKKIKSK